MKYIFSMKMAVFMLFAFAVIAGAGTFIENDFGTQTARALIYKAQWFEVFLGYFTAIVVYNIFKYKTYKSKPAVFLFHFSFLIIAIGALITRYVGYEGIMHIREGQSVNKMVSDAKILELSATDGKSKASLEKVLYFSSMTGNSLNESLKIGDKTVNVALLEYLPTAEYQMVSDPKGKTILELKVSAGGQGNMHYFTKGETKDFGAFYISYDVAKAHTDKPTFKISGEPNALKVEFPFIMKTLNMDTKNSAEIQGGVNDLHQRTLYRFGSNAVVLKSINEKSTLKVVSNFIKVKSNMPEYIKLKVSVGDKSQVVVAKPKKGKVGELQKLELDGVKIDLRIGAKIIDVPFSIKLEDFELERYPGSMTPASYSSKVVLIDKEANLTMPYHIYMNHILDYKNYRLFQSSYDPDEKGTVLSVNHDPGTLPTYIGYILMTLGMLWTLITPKGR